jgi:signal transduction histidine kinase
MPKVIVDDTAASGWTVAVRHRRSTLLQRVGLGCAVALVVAPMMGWPISLAWAALYIAAQGLELLAFAPINRGDTREMSKVRKALGCAVVFLISGLFGSLSVPMWLIGGPLGGVCAALMLPAIMLFSMTNATRSPAVLIASITPQLLFLAAMPFFAAAQGAPSALITTSATSVVLYSVFILINWQRTSEAAEARIRAHAEADRLRLKAEEDLAAHAAFLAAVGHDLRTPIGAILTGAAELKAGDSQARANAELITDAGLMMKALLDDLLDHSKIGAGRMTVDVADFNLRGMLAQTLRLWRGPAEAKGLSLRIEGAARMPGAVRGDAMRLRQVLNNLISIAMKFTPDGAITLRLNAWAEEPSGYSVLIEVADTGPGMSAEQLERLFTPFDQTADGVSALHGGSGLGLAISRDLIELMGGRLTARSTPGQGARFTVSLFLPKGETVAAPTPEPVDESRLAIARALADRAPAPAVVAPPEPEPAAAEPVSPVAPTQAEGDAEDERPLRLLVVDDHDINRRAVQLILEPLGCEITTAADGLIALDRCAETVFDVIFMDVRMPELDGREATRRLRAGGGPNVRTPVVAVTADTAPEDIAACQAAGMAYFVSKPLTPPALLGALQHVLSELEDPPSASEAA